MGWCPLQLNKKEAMAKKTSRLEREEEEDSKEQP